MENWLTDHVLDTLKGKAIMPEPDDQQDFETTSFACICYLTTSKWIWTTVETFFFVILRTPVGINRWTTHISRIYIY